MQSLITALKSTGKIRTAETYSSTLNCFKKFRKNKDLPLRSIDSKLMQEFQSWQKSNGLTQNTVSFYNRILRAVYNRAVEDKIIENLFPFRHVYTGIGKTKKRALTLSAIKKIKSVDLSLYPSEDFARDMFILSFMLRGMSFIDMAFIKKTDLANGRINYRRRKTGQLLSIEWTKEMQLVIDKYPRNRTRYLLPIITKEEINQRCAYKYVSYKINKSLKKISNRLKLGVPLSMYVARHSWASIAHSNGIPLSIISEGLGHDSELTTKIYLASLDNSVIDKANHRLITLL